MHALNMILQQPLGGRKYYMKYLSSAPQPSGKTGSISSVLSNDAESVPSRVHFETWKDQQQKQSERLKHNNYASVYRMLLSVIIIGIICPQYWIKLLPRCVCMHVQL